MAGEWHAAAARIFAQALPFPPPKRQPDTFICNDHVEIFRWSVDTGEVRPPEHGLRVYNFFVCLITEFYH
jgi:hypothetical protein